MLSVIMLTVIMLNVIMLSVVVPFHVERFPDRATANNGASFDKTNQ
jgi:hypothetical protein